MPSCAEGGVLGILPGLVGLIQATEVIKLMLETGESLVGRLMLFDALKMSFRELKLRKNPDCPACGDDPTVTKLIDYEMFCGITAERREESSGIQEITAMELKSELDQDDDIFLLDVRKPVEYDICRIEGSHLIPLDELLNRVHELDTARNIVAYCRSGARSAKAIEMLQEVGFKQLRNLEGGILAWADSVDPSIPQY